jgi:limonene-1,2-epoxide hydrolase
MIRSIISVLTLACLLSGCSIFDMKNPEPPLVGGVTEDPLNLGNIIRIVRESAVDTDYRDYFTGDVVFEYTLLRRVEGRDNVIHMLNRLRTQTSHVEWQTDRIRPPRPEGNMWVIEGVPYTVYSGGRQICTGTADFRIVDWVISYWKDVPNEGSASFFEP